MQDVGELSTGDLAEAIERFEAVYRSGTPEVSDYDFDHVYLAELQRREPSHPLLKRVGAEPDFGVGKVVHPQPMLSTDKVYSESDVRGFTERVSGAAADLGIDPEKIVYQLTPKLDGMAARYDGSMLVTRGDGLRGYNVSNAIEKGIALDVPGVGEIVMPSQYFDQHLKADFKKARNFVVGCISADTLKAESVAAFEAGAIQFVNYISLQSIDVVGGTALCVEIEQHCEAIEKGCEYPTDGTVVAIVDERIRDAMGHTSSFHRWQCAKKRKGESAQTVVKMIEWTTGRTGRVTPTVVVEPVHLSGAKIGRVTAHHAGNVVAQGIGVGSVLRLLRAGEVIPFIDAIITPASVVETPTECPTCDSVLEWEGDFIVCTSTQCDAQTIRRMHHFFDIIGNVDAFGEKTVRKIHDAGHDNLLAIYALQAADFEACGFGPKQSENLVAELQRSRTNAVEDWRFLGAMGISRLGRGSSRRLLKVHTIYTINSLSVTDIEAIESFGPVVAPSVHAAIKAQWPIISGLLGLGFNLVSSQAESGGPLSGKRIVFTGAMQRPRKDMEKEAESLGAEVQKSVSKTTDLLVTGERVGATKITKANKLGVRVIPLADYESEILN